MLDMWVTISILAVMAIFDLAGMTLVVVRIFPVVVLQFWLFGYKQSNIGGVLHQLFLRLTLPTNEPRCCFRIG